MNKALQRLNQLRTFTLDLNKLRGEAKVKIIDTARYSLDIDPSQDRIDVLKRCRIAIPAEYVVADFLDGYVNDQVVDHNNNDPYEWAWDVLAHPYYQGVRVEVKTHFVHDRANHKPWINVTTGKDGPFPDGSGINLGPIFKHKVADCIIIFVAEEVSQNVIRYTPMFAGGIDHLMEVVKPSRVGAGGYIMHKF
ncbi:hypothetical protein [Klebsiella variicola]|uniref:hypothetical protein n=1 Tax=Klebsiella variicola TaxID=244366 RepID=UPI001C6520CE|nr:hypothetical protein [Klebsiella variicola]